MIWLTTVRSDGQPITRIGFDPDGFALACSVALRVTPERWQVW